MLCYSGCAVAQEFYHHLQAYSSVQAPGSIGVPGNVGKDRFINTHGLVSLIVDIDLGYSRRPPP